MRTSIAKKNSMVVAGATCLCLLLALGCSSRQVRRGESGARTAVSSVELEAQVFKLANSFRRARELPRLELDVGMSEVARGHSRKMASRGKLGHRGSGQRFRSLQKEPWQLVSMAENVAFNYGHADPAAVAMHGWIRSPGHLRNLSRAGDQLTGIGVARASDGSWYFTQLFGRR